MKKKEAELKAAEQELAAKFEKLRAIHVEEQRQLKVQIAVRFHSVKECTNESEKTGRPSFSHNILCISPGCRAGAQ